MALRDRVLNQRIPSAEVQQIIFIDAGGHNQERRLLDVGRLWRVLDQLDQFILEDNRPRGYRKIATDLEGGLINSCDATFVKVVDQVLHPVGEARRPRFDRLADISKA